MRSSVTQRPARPLPRRAALALSAAAMTGVALAAPQCQAPANLIANPGFEAGTWAPGGKPNSWEFESWSTMALGSWDNTVAHSGRYSARIDAGSVDDARWFQSTTVPAGVPLYMGGWIKTANVQRGADQPGSPGATISALGRWDQTEPTLGTTRWHRVGMSFINDTSTIVAAPRLGFWGGLASGTAWYDDLTLVPRVADVPHPRWKILLLVYPRTDVTLTINGVPRHVRGESSRAELDKTAEQARLFVQRDIPALSSGNMLPTLTIRQARQPLKSLSPVLDGWWPAQGDVAGDLDPDFDSVIVVWDPRVKDVVSGESLWIGAAAGLTPSRGVSQTYVTMSVEYAGVNGHRNVYKHEWGHSILSYFEALQRTPQPTVTNHASESQYVNCKTGQYYVWQDETNDQPIPNSIYSNTAGFTHDYYSGTVARAEDPKTCLGIGPQAWAWGGPVNHSGSQPTFRLRDRLQALLAQLDALHEARMLDGPSLNALSDELRAVHGATSAGRLERVRASLLAFSQHVQALVQQKVLPAQPGALLIEAARAAAGCAT